ncbi:MAG: hypothetical protein DI626_05670 [Micavibrio aeruginosavorus]|uniref:Uncharacterized protein n=1 Tax=Micavibrio aeruginosavorus TaxID=349221 RepID=A0A2W5A2R4_9BACT|nr:MAG: hypothetical protein DI626_05670 [Micavibrio aeruginosavorus]
MKDNPAAQLAKMTALLCVRNTFLEDLHSGPMPISKTGDYSDVKVIDAEGNEIPWNQVSRLNNAEMKQLMKQVVNRLYTFNALADNADLQKGIEGFKPMAYEWDEPELDEFFTLLTTAKRVQRMAKEEA